MTDDELLQLVEDLEETAIEFGEHRYETPRPYGYATKADLQNARTKLRNAILELYWKGV